MHLQSGVPNWKQALVRMPDGAVLKAFSPDTLTEGRQAWAAAGRDQSKLFTILRHYDFIYPFDREYSTVEHTAIAIANWFRVIDRTYIERHAANVSAIETYNEHYDTRMVTDGALMRPHFLAEQAMAAVWNTSYRGRTITTRDGGHGTIPADCRLVLGNSPVGNDIPRSMFELAISTDNILGYHPYTRYLNRVRDSQDFRYHMGRWHFNEQEYGLRPLWAFTECGPYVGSAEGWRHPTVLGGDQALLIEAMRLWVREIAQTPAYAEGRIMGPGCWFTSGAGGSWDYYELETAQLEAIADMMRPLWVQHPRQEGDDMDATTRAAIREHANAILALVADAPQHTMRDLTGQEVINLFYRVAGNSYDWLTRARILPSPVTTAWRQALYTGPSVENLPLTPEERARVIGALG